MNSNNSKDLNRTIYIANLLKDLTKDKKTTHKPRLLILVGLPYSGKSTLSQELEKRNFVHIWTTKIRKALGLNDEEGLELIEQILSSLLAKGYSVSFDYLNHKRVYRDRFVVLARKFNAETEILYLNTPYIQIIRRMKQTFMSGGYDGRSLLNKEVIDEIKSEFEVPLPEENVIVLNTTMDITKYLDKYKVCI